MDPARFERIDRLLAAALALAPEVRADFLRRSCAGDDELRREVEALLAGEAGADLLETPALAHLAEESGSRPNAALAGQRLGQYLLKERLGAGGMGEVWKAWDERLEREVAIKVLPPEFAIDPERVRRFEQEAHTVSALNHPNIVTVHDFGHSGELYYIVTELVAGSTLRHSLREARPSWRDAVRIATQIAAALTTAHTAGVIHRDVKPENIMIQADGLVKVLDFGIAKWIGGGEAGGNPASSVQVETMFGARPGTLKYMSPEQARGEPLDARTDIFSLGLVLYEMLAGRHPYGGVQGEEALATLSGPQELSPVSEESNRIPAALDRIVNKAIRKNREERYASTSEMLADMERLRSRAETSHEKQSQKRFRAQNANQLLTQYAVFYDSDQRTRMTLPACWEVWRFSDLKRGPLERELLRKSLIAGLARLGRGVVITAFLALAAAAAFSVSETWDEKILRDGHTAAVREAAFSPDGRLLVSVGEDKRVIVWDFAQRRRLATLGGHETAIHSIAFAPDGRRFATASADGAVIVWDALRYERIAYWRDRRVSVECVTSGGVVVFSPDGRLVVSADCRDGSNSLVARDTKRWEPVFNLSGAAARNPVFSPDSRQVIAGIARDSYAVFDTQTGRLLAQKRDEDKDGPLWMALSPDGARFATVTSAGDVSFYQLTQPGDLTTRRLLRRERAHHDHGRTIEFSPDGRLVASGAEHIVLWDARTLDRLAVLEHSAIVWSLAFAPDARQLVSTHGDGSILVWDLAQRTRKASLGEHSAPVRACAFTSDGRRAATASEDQSIIIWDLGPGRNDAVLVGHDTRINGVAFSPDGRWLVAADQGCTVVLWDVTRRQPRWKVTTPGVPGYCAATSPDGHFVAATPGVYDLSAGQQVIDLSPGGDPWGRAYGVAFSPDGRRLACATDLGWILVWDVPARRLLARKNLASTAQIAVSFSPDGRLLVTGEDQGEVRLWNAEPLEQIAVLGRHQARIKSVAFSPDGREVASAGDDNTIRLWDVEKRRPITQIGMHTAPVLAVAFSPDGKQLLAGGHDRSVRLYTRHTVLWGWRWD